MSIPYEIVKNLIGSWYPVFGNSWNLCITASTLL